MIDPVVVGLVSAATALVASIAGPLTALYIGRSQIRAAVLSTNRQKWIDSFRESIAAFCSQAASIVHLCQKVLIDGRVDFSNEPEVLRRFEALFLTFTRIRLLTDPFDDRQQQLLDTLQGLLRFMQNALPADEIYPEVEATVARIVAVSVGVVRGEWGRVKNMD